MIGKLIGAIAGLILLHGWVGFLIGVTLGHLYDRSVARLRQPSLGVGFVEPLFGFAGAVAKSDGRVSEPEIAAAEALMQRLGLDAERRKLAVECFNAGKQPEFDVGAAIAALRGWCRGRADLGVVVLDLVVELVYAEGQLAPPKLVLVRRLLAALGVAERTFLWLAAMKGYAAFTGGTAPDGAYSGPDPRARTQRPAPPTARDPYAVLGVSRSAGAHEIKQAYRKLISQNHPDKLGDVPDEIKRRAEQRASEINAAWEQLKLERGFK